MSEISKSLGNTAVYGVDIKIDPQKRPWLIEINGVNFGTDFFKYHQGLDYYPRFMRSLGQAARGKPIFIETSGDDSPDPHGAYARTQKKQGLYLWSQ